MPADQGTGRPRPGPAQSRMLPEVTVSVNLKKVITWLVVAFVIFYVIRAPDQSAQFVRNAGHALGSAASSLAAFVGSLT